MDDDRNKVSATLMMGNGTGGAMSTLAALTQGAANGTPGEAMAAPTMAFGIDENFEESLKKQLRRRASFARVEDECGVPQKMEGDVRFLRVWVEHQRDAFLAGTSEIYFFPAGFTERAIIALTDDDRGERVLSLEVRGLTARTRIVDELLEIPRG